MALMIPNRQYTDFHDSKAEERVFDCLSNQLSDSYRVYHSENWYRAPGQSTQDQERGEIDFLVCHQEKGLLVLEVKGGGIEYEPERDTWYTINDEGQTELDKSPAQQATAAKYALLNRLEEHPTVDEEGQFPGIVGWGLVFPDFKRDRGLDLPDMELPRERILFRDDLDALDQRLRDLYDFWDHQRHFTGPMGEGVWESLTSRFLRRKFHIMQGLGTYLEASEENLMRMTDRQRDRFEILGRQTEAFVRGCAGSGKTLLSKERALHLSQEGKDVLWLCFNKQLARYVESSLEDGDVHVHHFHEFARQVIEEAGLEFDVPSGYDAQREYFDEDVPELLENAIGILGLTYDALIIDEAQDFPDGWYLTLLALLGEQSSLYVFYDPNQLIYLDELPDWLKEKEGEAYPLEKNVRNTQKIGRAALEVGNVHEDVQFERKGRDVEVDLVDSPSGIPDALRKAFHALFQEEDLDPHRAVVLNRRRKENSELDEYDTLGNYKVVQEPDEHLSGHQVLYSTIHSFKGLESDVVFLLDPGMTKKTHRKLFYTGASRAKHLLWVITVDEEVKERIQLMYQ